MIWQVVQPGGPPHPYWSSALPTVSVEGALPVTKRLEDFEKLDEAILHAFKKGAVEIRVYGRRMTSGERRRWYGRQVFHIAPDVF